MMPTDEPPQKEVELRVVAAARKAGAPIPNGKIVVRATKSRIVSFN
jgi:hypothetical protein